LERSKERGPLGRPRRRWEDSIRTELREIGWKRVEFIDLAQDRNRWRDTANMAGGQAGRRAGRQAGRQAGGQAGGQAGRRVGRQAGRQAGGQAGRRAGGLVRSPRDKSSSSFPQK
jgi:hypothetical protein